MNSHLLFLSKVFLFFVIFSPCFAQTAVKKRACPDKWQVTTESIPVIKANTKSPWGKGDDKPQAKKHLSKAKIINTIDKDNITADDLVGDLLTVASECLVYRNLAVDGYGTSTQPSIDPNTDYGWLPAAVF